MNTIDLIHDEIDELSERRGELWNRLSQGRDPAWSTSSRSSTRGLTTLGAHRAERARIRFGERERHRPARPRRRAARARRLDARRRRVPAGNAASSPYHVPCSSKAP